MSLVACATNAMNMFFHSVVLEDLAVVIFELNCVITSRVRVLSFVIVDMNLGGSAEASNSFFCDANRILFFSSTSMF